MRNGQTQVENAALRRGQMKGGRRNGMMEKSAKLLSGLFNWQRECACLVTEKNGESLNLPLFGIVEG